MLLAGCQAFGIESDCVPRIATGLGGGIGKGGEVCGALTGGAMLIGLLRGREDASDLGAKDEAYAITAEFVHSFKEVNGALRCRDLLQLDIAEAGGMTSYRERNLKDNVCTVAVSNALRILVDLIGPSE